MSDHPNCTPAVPRPAPKAPLTIVGQSQFSGSKISNFMTLATLAAGLQSSNCGTVPLICEWQLGSSEACHLRKILKRLPMGPIGKVSPGKHAARTGAPRKIRPGPYGPGLSCCGSVFAGRMSYCLALADLHGGRRSRRRRNVTIECDENRMESGIRQQRSLQRTHPSC